METVPQHQSESRPTAEPTAVSPAPAALPEHGTADPGGTGTGGPRWRNALILAWPALAAYLSVRLLGMAVFLIWAQLDDRSPIRYLARADAYWYLRIAEHGYGGEYAPKDLAFFPLYPGLVAIVETISPFGFRGTGVLVSWLGSIAAAWALFMIGNHLYNRRVGILLAVLWGCLPHAVVQSMAYSEGIFTAICGWALYAVLTRRWITAGLLALAAGLTRPTASALIAVVGLAALIAVFQRRDGWRPWLTIALTPLGWLGYLLWVAGQTGRIDGWFHIQSDRWGTSFDGGRYTLRNAYGYLTSPSDVDSANLSFYAVTGVLIVAVGLFVLSVRQRQPWQLLVFSGLLLITTIGASGYFHSKARFLIPGFALLLPVAVALGRTNRITTRIIVGALAVLSAGFGAYLLLVWRFSP